jgi:hypothetical protein
MGAVMNTLTLLSPIMYAQCDEEGNPFNLIDIIVDHKTAGHAVERTDTCIKHASKTQVRETTKGWHLCVEWKYCTTSWEHLVDLKESNHFEVAEYAPSKNRHDAPAFIWRARMS